MSGADRLLKLPLPPVSVIVATRGRPEMAHAAVRSILEGRARPAEIVIVDQSDAPHPPPAGTPDCPVRYLHRPGRGLSRANNQGAGAAAHEILVFTHDDVLVDAEWLSRLVGALVAGPARVVTGRVVGGAPEAPGAFAPALAESGTPALYRGRVGYDVLKPMNMALHRDTLLAAGGWDPELGPGTSFHAAEDADLGFRLLEAGFAIRFVPEAAVTHRAWRRERDFLALRWRYGLGHGAFYAKHLRPGDLHMARRYLGDARRRLRVIRHAREGGWRRAAGKLLFLLAVPLGAARWWWRNRRSHPDRRV